MSDYKIEVTDEARASIRSYAGYIEKRSGSWRTAERWVDRVLKAIQTLQYMPDRYELAEEASIRDYAIHRLIIGDYLALYHIVESKRTVNVIGFRHGSRLPRLSELPEDLGHYKDGSRYDKAAASSAPQALRDKSMPVTQGQEVIGTLLIGLAMLAMFSFYCQTIVWAYRDARLRGKPGWLIAAMVAFPSFWPFSALLWYALRPPVVSRQLVRPTREDDTYFSARRQENQFVE